MPGKKTKSSKAKLAMDPHQETLLTAITGCLKFLTANANSDCFRVAQIGCLPHLVLIHSQAKKTLLRRNSQVSNKE